MKIAVVGATGMVGRTMMKVLEERNFPVSQLLPAATLPLPLVDLLKVPA